MEATKYKLIFLMAMVLLSCQQEKVFKTDQNDYNHFLASEPMKTTSKYYQLWDSKIKQDSLQILSLGNVAGEYSRYFQGTGDIKYLKMAEQSLKKAVDVAAVGKAGYLRALARNYISQHRFKEALDLALAAREQGSGVNASQSLLFDVHMELGNYQEAHTYLDSIRNMSDFGYLIRLAKWNDHKGDLDTAIRFMEKAYERAQTSKNKDLMLWSSTNLADFYGHAGRIEDSYKLYLNTLEMDPQNAYAKKGIAWIVYSHERDGKEALRIMDSIIKKNQSPDYFLLKAEIAEFIGNEALKLEALDNYHNRVGDKGYGEMYNAHNIDFLIGMEVNGKALKLAQREVENRPTPESYGLLAYSYLKKGEKEKALELVENFIWDKTFEPAILTQAAEIYKENGNLDKVKELKQELTGAIYELGPLKEDQILSL